MSIPNSASEVQTHYGAHATGNSSEAYTSAVAASFGYTAEELSSIPKESNLGVSCGNPLALANLNEGETVIDLGSGGGLDVFLAARSVGASGKAIGIDMTTEMIDLARRNAEKGGYKNAEFVQANITDIPLPDASADVITSNCVINLVPDAEKSTVFKEIHRLLKSGGRVALSDLLATRTLPDEIRGDVGLYIGCVAGASSVEEYKGWLVAAGFKDPVVVATNSDVNVYKEGIMGVEGKEKAVGGCCGVAPTKTLDDARQERLRNLDLNEYVGSFQIYAVKD